MHRTFKIAPVSFTDLSRDFALLEQSKITSMIYPSPKILGQAKYRSRMSVKTVHIALTDHSQTEEFFGISSRNRSGSLQTQ